MAALTFLDREQMALAAANEVISSYAKLSWTVALCFCSWIAASRCSNFDIQFHLVIRSPSYHFHSLLVLPIIHSWGLYQLSFGNLQLFSCVWGQYFFMNAVSFPRCVSHARYGHVSIGNLGNDEALALCDVSFSRQPAGQEPSSHVGKGIAWIRRPGCKLPAVPFISRNVTMFDTPIEGMANNMGHLEMKCQLQCHYRSFVPWL
jgi:hypothetical protein